MEKAWALDPGDAETSSALAQCYDLERAHAASPDEQAALANKALSLRESALEKQGGENRFYELGDLAKSAFAAGDLDKAQQYASELLLAAPKFKNDWNYGNAVHQGNNVLGLIELLEKGERDAVLAYLQSCGKFWKMGRDSLQAWTAVVNQGGTPDFGANLDY